MGRRKAVHIFLEIEGLIPDVGRIADMADGALCVKEGKYWEAARSAVTAIPKIGDLTALESKELKGISPLKALSLLRSKGTKRLGKVMDGARSVRRMSQTEWRENIKNAHKAFYLASACFTAEHDSLWNPRHSETILDEGSRASKSPGEMRVSQKYIDFVVDYEGGKNNTKWKYAQDLGDGCITIAFGVVIKARNGSYPLKKPKYDELMRLKDQNIALTWDEALDLTMEYMESEYAASVRKKATEKGWTLNQNRFDALVDMTWNCGPDSLRYDACEYLATGDLEDADTISRLEKEIVETAYMEIRGVDMWTKNLVERRTDVIRMAQGGADAYTRNELSAKYWNQNAKAILQEMGLNEKTINKYRIQKVREY